MGPNGANMGGLFRRLGAQRKAFADWTDRIAAGAYPEAPPPRPAGVERNLVISMWDWALPTSRRSDAAGTDERSPTVNANGLIYGAIQTSDILAVLDPQENSTMEIKIPSNGPVLDASTPRSMTWGDEKIWQRQADPRSVAMDAKGRVWVTARNRAPQQQPAFCKDGATNKFAKYFPMPGPSNRQVQLYDPKTKQFTMIDTCFAADHNLFDEKDALLFGQDNAIGWVDTPMFDKTHDAAASQAWCPGVVDTNGDGKISTGWTEPKEPIDPKRDHRIEFGCYSIGISPTDGAVWCSGIDHEDKTLVRIERGPNPPMSCKAEVYVPPPSTIPLPYSGGVAIDSHGVVWQNWRGVHEIFSFDRRKCKVLNGPTATGQQCPEGWTVHKKPGPTFKGEPELSTDMLYLGNIDHHDALGLGKDVLLEGDVNADSFWVMVPQNGQMQTLTLRVPYPLGFHSRHAAGRIDDPKAGWKGRGLWSSYSMYTPWHQEGGKGTQAEGGEVPGPAWSARKISALGRPASVQRGRPHLSRGDAPLHDRPDTASRSARAAARSRTRRIWVAASTKEAVMARHKGPIRYAVVGLGHIAQVAVLPAFAHARRNSRLTALVSDDATKLKVACQEVPG